MEYLNDWFPDIEKLNVDEKIAELRNIANRSIDPLEDDLNAPGVNGSSQSELISLLKAIQVIDNYDELKDFEKKNYQSLQTYNLLLDIDQKSNLLENKQQISRYKEINDKIFSFSVNENDKFNSSFYFESDINILSNILIEILNLSNEQIKLSLLKAFNQKIISLKKAFVKTLTKLIEQSNWSEIVHIDELLLTDINNCCYQLNRLQNLYLISCHKLSPNNEFQVANNELWSVEIILQPIITKFIYHFYGKSLTNKLNQPELAIEYFLNDLENESFLKKIAEYFSKSLKIENNYKLTEISENVKLISDKTSIIIEVIKVFNKFLRIKFLNDLHTNHKAYFNNSNSRLFNNLIYQLNTYELNIFELFYFKDLNLIKDILFHNSIWKYWINLESQHILKTFNDKFPRFSSSTNSSTSESKDSLQDSFNNHEIFEIDFNIVKENYLKPTKISTNVSNLIKNLIDFNILNLNIPTILKVKILKELVFKILELYYEKIINLLKDPYIINNQSNTSYLNNLITDSLVGLGKRGTESTNQKQKKINDDGILNEIKTICKLYCSVKYVLTRLQSYNNELEFIKIFDYLKKNLETNDNFEFEEKLITLELNKNELLQIINSNPTNEIFHSQIKKFNSLVEELLQLSNIFMKKSLKIYLKNYLSLTEYWYQNSANYLVDNNDDDGWEFDDDDLLNEESKDIENIVTSEIKFTNIESFKDFITYGFNTVENKLTKNTMTKELQSPINILITQLKFLKNCFGLNYLPTLHDYKLVELNVLRNLNYYFYSYVIKINKFSLNGVIKLKFDYLLIIKKILFLDDSTPQSTTINFQNYEILNQQQFLIKIIDCCNVLMINDNNLKNFLIDPNSTDFQRFRNLQNFTKLRKVLSIRSISDDEIYDLVSRIIQ